MKIQENHQDQANMAGEFPLILADAHVHLHDCFTLEQLLESALRNFSQFSQSKQMKFQGALFLVEMANQSYFNQFLHKILSQKHDYSVGQWRLYRTQETSSMIASHFSGQKIFIFAGRQIVTSEKLEVLALITDQNFSDGMSLKETIEKILSVGGIPVLPWGVGKWIGKRGNLLKDILHTQPLPLVFLGDNSGRPMFWFRSPYFEKAKEQGLRILPGTDPLPLPSECRRPGSFGFKVQGSLSQQRPGEDIKSLLLDNSKEISSYGSLENPFRFFRNQLAIRVQGIY
jgi:hypothetical protein